MNKEGLCDKLTESYTSDNLNRITSVIISIYRKRDFNGLKVFSNLIHPVIPDNSQTFNQLFSQLLMLYHPDRLDHFRNQIKSFQNEENWIQLEKMTHILTVLQHLDGIFVDSLDGKPSNALQAA